MTKVYTLYLSTSVISPTTNLIVPLNVTDKGNATWQVDFRSLFNGDNNRFKRCQVRFNLQSSSWTAGGTDWNTFQGYLSLNLPSTYTASTSKGTPLGLIFPIDAPTTSTTTHVYQVSTLGNAVGVDINMPSDNQLVNFQFLNDDSFSNIGSVPDWQILLSFELSEPIEGCNCN